MQKRLLLVLLVTLLIFAVLFGWRFRQIQTAMEQHKPPPPATVAVTEVARVEWQPYLSVVGSLVAIEGIQISNEVAGKVKNIHFVSGQTVEPGQLLIELDSDSEEAEFKRLQATRGLAKIKFGRTAKLANGSYISQSDYDEAKALLEQADASLVWQQTLIDKKRIRAPFAGSLGIRRANTGQYLPPGTAIVPLQALDPIYADFSLPERYLAQLGLEQTVEVDVQAYPGERFSGKITALNPGIDDATRSLVLRATLDNASRRLRPGMFARIRVLLGAPEQVLTLPDTAITYNTYGDSVFLVQPDGAGHKVERRQVETGESRDGRVAIRSGLEIGQRVVSAGQLKLRNGVPVLIDDQPAPSERGPQP